MVGVMRGNGVKIFARQKGVAIRTESTWSIICHRLELAVDGGVTHTIRIFGIGICLCLFECHGHS